jgi:uncharacterized protein
MSRSAAAWLLPLAIGFMAATAGAQPRAASPPCTAPAGPLQAEICASPELRAADARLRALERTLAGTTSRPATMAHRARAWQRQLEDGARDDLAGEYEDRIGVLEEQLRQDRAIRRLEQRRDANGRAMTVFPRPATLERDCLGGVLRDCRVTGAGTAMAEDGRTRVVWQAQAGFTERDGVRAGIVLLAEARGGWRLLGWSFEGHRYDAPRLIQQDSDRLLHLPGRGGGSGSANMDLLYRLAAEGWQEVEAESWKLALPARLPQGLEVWQAVEYDFAELIANSRLWRDQDGNCCPSGGNALFELRIEGTSVVLEGVSLDATARALQPGPEACPAERATYRLNAAADFTAELRGGWPGTGFASDLLLRVHSPATGAEYWFRFGASQGYGGLFIDPVEAPGPRTREDGVQALDADDDLLALLRFHPLHADLTVLGNPPHSGQPAPRHMFTPGLGQALHYVQIPGQRERERMPPALWTLAACRPG